MDNTTEIKGYDLGYGDKTTAAGWAFSILSDAQELISMGFKQEAIDKINNAKRVLLGKYKELDNGFSIEVEQMPKRC